MTCEVSVEYLRNIKKLHVYTSLDAPAEKVLVAIRNAFELGPLSKSKVDSISVLAFANCVPKHPLPPMTFSTLEAKDLRESTFLSCKCGHVISQDASLIYKDLPSKYWMDLIDCWSCHKSEFAPITNKIDICATGSQLILPAKGTVHIGLEGLLCSAKDVDLGLDGRCPACGDQVGDAMESHTMLFWHMLNIAKAERSSFCAPSPLKSLLSRLHEHMQSFASQSFNIMHQDDLVSLTVMNWDLVTLDLSSSSLVPAVKLLIHSEPLTNYELVKVDRVTMQILNHSIRAFWPSIKTSNGHIITVKYQ